MNQDNVNLIPIYIDVIPNSYQCSFQFIIAEKLTCK